MTLMKGVIIVLLIFIFVSLGSAVYYLIKDSSGSTRVVKALTWRIGLSIVLFLLLMLAYAMGWLTPHQI